MIRSRIAPTPSGHLHLGNAFNFILTWVLTKKQRGELLLRIDDMDSSRTRLDYIDDIFHCLEWLGIDWQLGPTSPSDFVTHHSQQLKTELYRQELNKLSQRIALYPCDCSRKMIETHSMDGKYSGLCRLAKKEHLPLHTALRLWIDEEALHQQVGDIVIWRKDDLPAYQLVSVLEDEWNKINLIVRGEDLFESTMIQRYLANKLDCHFFPQATIFHHSLLKNDSGQKLSKSQGALDLREWRGRKEEGRREAIRQFCHFFQLPIVDTLTELLDLDFNTLTTSFK